MAVLFVRHKVDDFKTWKKGYDDFDAERQSLGVTGHGVFQLDGDPNDVTVYHEFATMEAAKAFATSDRLKEVMDEAGVQGAPDIWFTNQA